MGIMSVLQCSAAWLGKQAARLQQKVKNSLAKQSKKTQRAWSVFDEVTKTITIL